MKSFKFLQSMWLCAICAGVALFSSCGGGSSSTTLSTTPNPNLSCSIKVNVLRPPAPSDASWSNFQTYVLSSSAINGVDLVVPWSQIETSQGQPNFATLDAELPSYEVNGKKINIIWMAINYGNVNNPQGGVNTSTPAYVFTPQWASSLTPAAPPQDVAYCSNYPGNGTFVDTFANASTSGFDSSGYPVVYEAPFRVAYQRFIQAALQHYQGNTHIGYMRFALSVGGEADAYCVPQLEQLPAPNTFVSPTTWENWISTMYTYEKSVLPTPTIQLMQSLNPLQGDPTTLPSFEATNAVSNGFGFGTNGWQKSDISASNGTCTADWCALFDKYAGQVPLELQTITITDPTNSDSTNPTGSLVNLIPIAVQHHATILELSLQDVNLALDPNYASQNPSVGAFAGAYKTAVTNACAQ
jgi:hypothetical protein